MLFWSTSSDPSNTVLGQFYGAPLSGGALVPLPDGNTAAGIAADGTYLFYTSTTLGAHGLARMNQDGSSPTSLSTHYGNLNTADADTVYFSEDPCFNSGDDDGCEGEPTIYAVPKVGGATTTVAESPKGLFTLLQQDGYLYWSLMGDSAPTPAPILRVPVTGGAPSTIATSPLIQALAVDAASVYWLRLTGFNSENYEVVKAPVAGGSATVLFSELGNPANAMAVDDTAIVWSAAGKLYLLAK
jgi:hypothetical protein